MRTNPLLARHDTTHIDMLLAHQVCRSLNLVGTLPGATVVGPLAPETSPGGTGARAMRTVATLCGSATFCAWVWAFREVARRTNGETSTLVRSVFAVAIVVVMVAGVRFSLRYCGTGARAIRTAAFCAWVWTCQWVAYRSTSRGAWSLGGGISSVGAITAFLLWPAAVTAVVASVGLRRRYIQEQRSHLEEEAGRTELSLKTRITMLLLRVIAANGKWTAGRACLIAPTARAVASCCTSTSHQVGTCLTMPTL